MPSFSSSPFFGQPCCGKSSAQGHCLSRWCGCVASSFNSSFENESVRQDGVARFIVGHCRAYLIMLPVVSSAVFLSVRPSLIAVEFGLSFQLLSCGFSFRHGGGGGRWKRKEGEGGRSGKARVVDQTAGTTERASTPLSILSVGSIRARRSGCAGGSPK
jgi:hypothetical protein